MFELWPEPSRTKWRDRFATIFSADERTLVGAMLGIQQALSVFARRSVVQATSHSSFRLETLAFQPTTLVIGLPTQPRENRQILTSLFIRQLLDVLGRIGEKRRPQGLPVPVTLYLDEIGTLGYIGNLPEYVATYRDIKVAFVLATQDTEQLTGLFEKEQAETLLANLHTRVVFGYDLRPEQAVRISRDLGEKIILEPTAEYKGGLLSQKRSGARVLVSTRPLLTSDELRNMKPFEAVVVLPGNRKAVTYMKPVHEDPDIPPSLPVQPH
jgi:type IV secretory pathway TraG/TraD family ATPase VirD4